MFTNDMTIEDADRLSFRRSVLKKFSDVRHPDAGKRAIEGFIADNARCSSFQLQPQSWWDDYFLGEVKTHLDKWLHDSDGAPATLSSFADLGRCGPGASVDVDLATFYTKLFDSTLAGTNPTLRRLYGATVGGNPTWALAEDRREHRHGSMTVLGSTLGTVPKQYDIDRTIATEPPLNMFFQLGIGGHLTDAVLRPLGINLSTQPVKNQWLAYQGSMFGRDATIDLKSASNSISLGLRPLFPRYFWDWLMRTRSPKTRLPSGEWIDLHMLASMGNGFCFPLQTMLFGAVVCSVYTLMGMDPKFGSSHPRRFLGDLAEPFNAGVFGDDIVVRTPAYHQVVRGLELLGFQVNLDKSFHTGTFRESCGADFFRGVNIRGVYLKTLKTAGDCYSSINRLVRWSAVTGIPLDFTIGYLLQVYRFHPIPPSESDDLGVHVPQLWGAPEWYSLTGSRLYYVAVKPVDKLTVPLSDDDEPGTLWNYQPSFNPDGVVYSWVGGYISGGAISLREDAESSYSSAPEVLLRSVPWWDYRPKAEHWFTARDDRWEAYVERVISYAYTRWLPNTCKTV